jgi:geranylgeranyl diphosphate synthase type I
MMDPAFSQAMTRIVEQIDKVLVEVLEEQIQTAELAAPGSVVLLDAIADFVNRGGKRLRGALVILGHRSRRPESAEALRVAAAMELFHAYILAHDDIMDRDDLRRGGPTLHAHFIDQSNDVHRGLSLGILCGNMLCAWAHELILSLPEAVTAMRAIKELARFHSRTVLGQYLDVEPPTIPGVNEVQRTHDLKRGEYSFLLPLRLGAVLAGASDAFLNHFTPYAMHLGRAFQAKDDLLGLFGDPEITGKPIGADILEGRHTWLVADLFASNPEAAKELQEIFTDEESDEAERVSRAIDIFEQTQSRQRCEAFISEQVQLACRVIEKAPITQEAREMLRGIAEYVEERSG